MKKIASIDLSAYIIDYALNKKTPISNLQLQKLLYFINGECFRETGDFIIEENFYAYPLGPVNKKAYKIYKAYGAEEICSRTNIELDLPIEDKKILDAAIDKYINLTAFELVNKSHKPGGAWAQTRKKNGMYSVIDTSLIKQEFSV